MLSKEEIEKAKKKLELMEYKYTLTDNTFTIHRPTRTRK